MPTVRYIGKWPTTRSPAGSFVRGEAQFMSQEHLDAQRHRLTGPDFEILDDANTPSPETDSPAVSEDVGPVGDPDTSWVRRDIIAWLGERDITVRAGLTKAQLLARVEEHLNPAPTEEVMDEAPSAPIEEDMESDE